MSPLPLWERSDRIDRCDPGEGLRSIDRPEPLTPALSHKGRGSAPPLPRYWAFNRCHFQTANSWTTVIARSDLSAVAQRAKAEATKQSRKPSYPAHAGYPV